MGVSGCQIIRVIALAVVILSTASARAGTAYLPTLKLAVEERYDSDFLVRRDSPLGNGQMITKLSPQVGLDVKDHTLNGTSFYAADIFIFHGSGLSGVDHRGAVELKHTPSRTTSVEGKLKIWRVSDPTSLPRLGLAREIAPVLFGTAELAVAAKLSARTTVRAGYLFEGLKIYETVSRRPSFLNSPYLETWYRATQRTELGADYRFQYFTFEGASADSHSIAAAYRYHFSPHMKFTAKAGPGWLQDRADPSHTGWFPRVNLELVRTLEHFEGLLVIGHDLVGASGYSSVLWADYAALAGSYKASKQLSVFANGSYFRNGRGPNDGIGSFDYRSGTWQGYAVSGGLEWRLTRFFALQGFVGRLAQVAGPSSAVDLSRNIVAVRLSITAL